MKTEDKCYSDYLENKYLPGRKLYLNHVFYPKLFRRFKPRETVLDLGCGTGEFLNYCRKNNRPVLGIDSNEKLAEKCRKNGFNVNLDSICELGSLKGQRFNSAICDNVLEHLEKEQIEQFFARMDAVMLPNGCLVCVVPGVKGFQKDPTHKTYVDHDLVDSLLENRRLKIEACYYHPINVKKVDSFFYLNMQVFEIKKL